MYNNFTNSTQGTKYKPQGRTPEIKTCYMQLTKVEAETACNIQKIPLNSTLYEYKENIDLKENNVIISVEVDTSNMLDMTNREVYIDIIYDKLYGLTEYMHKENIAVARFAGLMTIPMYRILGYIAYKVKDNSVVKRVAKA